MRVLVVLCLAAASASVMAAPKHLPASWLKCKRDDPEIGQCLREAIHIAIRALSDKGAKEYGVLPLDPLLLSKVDIGQGQGPVSLDLHFSDLNIHGLKNTKVMDGVKFSAPFHFRGSVHIPDGITLRGHYKVNGKVLVLPIRGEGPCELNLANATANVEIDGKEITKDGLVYIEITHFNFAFDTTHLKMRLENLFNGNKELSIQMNAFLNDNWKEILQELKPGIQDAFGAAFREIANRIFLKVPSDRLYA